MYLNYRLPFNRLWDSNLIQLLSLYSIRLATNVYISANPCKMKLANNLSCSAGHTDRHSLVSSHSPCLSSIWSLCWLISNPSLVMELLTHHLLKLLSVILRKKNHGLDFKGSHIVWYLPISPMPCVPASPLHSELSFTGLPSFLPFLE
jgi:hypothetical protein